MQNKYNKDKSINIISSQKKALSYLAKKARGAHLDGDGVLVNHICSVALSKIESWQKNKIHIPLRDFYWALVFTLYWLIDDFILDRISRIIKNIEHKNRKEKDILIVYNEAFYLINESLYFDFNNIEKLKKCKLDWLNEEKCVEDEILLCLTIELIWFRGYTNNKWKELLDSWIKKVKSPIKKRLKELKFRLKIQTETIFSFPRSQSKVNFSNKNNFETLKIYKAWRSFLNCHWKELDLDLRDIATRYTFEHPNTLHLFHMHHITRFLRIFARQQDPQDVGLTRRRLLISSKKETFFEEMRDNLFYQHLLFLLNQSEPSKNAFKRFHCFRLSMLTEIAALRKWDIVSWIEAIRQQYKAYQELLRFRDETNIHFFAFETIRLGTLSISFEKNDFSLEKAIEILEQDKTGYIRKLIELLLKMRPVFWHSVLQVFYTLSDSIPENQMLDVAKWCVKYVNYPRGQLESDPVLLMGFWRFILPKTSKRMYLCKILKPIAVEAAENSLQWGKELGIFLKEFIVHAPLLVSIEIGRKMFKIKAPDSRFNRARWFIVFNAIKRRQELINYFKKNLKDTSLEPILNIYLPYLYKDSKIENINDPKLRKECRKQILEQIKNVIRRKEKDSIGFGREMAETISLLTWPNQEKRMVYSLVKAINSPNVLENEIQDFLIKLFKLVEEGHHTNAKMIKREFMKWMRKLPEGKKIFHNGSGPLSSFHVKFPSDVFNAFCRLLLAMCKRLDQRFKETISEWLEKFIINAPDSSIPVLLRINLYLGINLSNFNTLNFANNIESLFLQSIYKHKDSFKSNTSGLGILKLVGSFLESKREVLLSWTKLTDKNKKQAFLRILYKYLPLFAKSPDPNIRAKVGNIISLLKTGGKLPKKYDKLIQELKNDTRVRVRSQVRNLVIK